MILKDQKFNVYGSHVKHVWPALKYCIRCCVAQAPPIEPPHKKHTQYFNNSPDDVSKKGTDLIDYSTGLRKNGVETDVPYSQGMHTYPYPHATKM